MDRITNLRVSGGSWWHIFRQAIPIFIGFGCCWVLLGQLEKLEYGLVWRAISTVSAWQWAISILATLISFWAVARYDVIAHRHYATHVPPTTSAISGAASVALGQTLGAGVLVGAFVRWKMIPGIGPLMPLKIAGFVAMTFLASLALIVAIANLVLPTAFLPIGFSPIVMVVSLTMVISALLAPTLTVFGRSIRLPTLPAMMRFLALCLVDTIAAAFALYILLPTNVAMDFALFAPAFLIALGAAILSGTPGGLGPFELAILTLLPQIPEAPFVAAIISFRLVYYAMPAVLAAAVLFRTADPQSRKQVPKAKPAYTLEDSAKTLSLRQAEPAEMGVLRQNGGAFLECDAGMCSLVQTDQTLTSLFDPIQGHSGALVKPLQELARTQNRIACKYKISARHALQVKLAGWKILHVADEAILRPDEVTLEGPKFRQLRRKLRQASKSGVTVTCEGGALPWAHMNAISTRWEATHGGARGFSMGRFDVAYLQRQKIFLARQGAGFWGSSVFINRKVTGVWI